MKLMVLGKLKFDGDMKKADLLMPLFDEKTLVNTFSQAVPAGKPSHPHARAFQQGPAMEALPSDGLTEATGGEEDDGLGDDAEYEMDPVVREMRLYANTHTHIHLGVLAYRCTLVRARQHIEAN